MTEVDKHHVLDNKIFTYRASKDGRVFIYWRGKQVTVLKGNVARRFINKVEHSSSRGAQLVMAKATGNFKRGNER